MNVASRPVTPGKTRHCPHCKAVILESLTVCPGCLHHLRFDSDAARRQGAATSALQVEGVIRHPPLEDPWEYFVTIAIRNDRGEEVARQVVNVGVLQGTEKRTFTLSVEVLPSQAAVAAKTAGAATGSTGKPAAPNPGAPLSGAAASGGAAASATPKIAANGNGDSAASAGAAPGPKAPPPTHQPPGPASPYVLKPPMPGAPRPEKKKP